MMKKLLGFLILTLLIGVLAGSAQAVMFPSKSVVNPLTQTLYVADNTSKKIKSYQYTVNGWPTSPTSTKSINGKCYGMAVTPDGTELLVSVSNLGDSELRIFALNDNGIPLSSEPATDFTPSSISAPRGIAVLQADSGLKTAFMVDGGAMQLHVFSKSAAPQSKWERKKTHDMGSDFLGAYDIAVKLPKIFISKKVSNGKIFVYNYGLGTIAPAQSPITGVPAPTQLAISNDRLYVSVNGEGTADIYAYDISGPGPYTNADKTTISNPDGIDGAFGWTGFALNPSGTALYYTQSVDQAETQYKLYKANDLSNNETATFIATIPKADGAVVSPDNKYLTATYSGNGTHSPQFQISNLGSGPECDPQGPQIISVTPGSTEVGQAKQLTISGNYFMSTSKAYLNNIELDSIQVISQTTLKATVSAALTVNLGAGTYPVKVTNSVGNAILPSAFEITEEEQPVVNEQPDEPFDLTQNIELPGGILQPLAPGASTSETSIVFKFKMSDPNESASLTPEVVVIKEGGGRGTLHLGNPVNYTGTPVNGTVKITNLTDGNYTWKARVKETEDLKSDYVSFNGDVGIDFIINTDTTAPTVDETYPADNAVGVALDLSESNVFVGGRLVKGLVVTFSKPMQPKADWVAGQDFTAGYTDGDAEFHKINISTEAISWQKVEGQANRRLILPLQKDFYELDMEKEYTVTLTEGLTDANSNPLGAYSWTFTTGTDPSIVAPVVSDIYPSAADAGNTVYIMIEGQNFSKVNKGRLEQPDGSKEKSLTLVEYTAGDTDTPDKVLVTLDTTGISEDDEYQVVLGNPAGKSAHSINSQFSVGPGDDDTVPPPQITNFDAVGGEDKITLNWTNPDDLDLQELKIFRSESATPDPYIQINEQGQAINVPGDANLQEISILCPKPGVEVDYVDPNPVVPAKTYYYSIYARDTNNNWNYTLLDEGKNADDAQLGEAVGAPILDLTVFMQGYYQDSIETGIRIDVRDSLANTIGTVYGNLDGSGKGQIELTGIPDGNYYIVIYHIIEGAPEGANHLPIMTEIAKSFTIGDVTHINLSEPGTENYIAAYWPDPDNMPDPMFENPDGEKTMRGGDASADGVVGMPDFGAFGLSNGSNPDSGNWNPAADFDGSGVVGMSDFAIFGQNNGKISYLPQEGE